MILNVFLFFFSSAKLLEYPIPERLPFGYPLIPPYPFSNVSSAVSQSIQIYAHISHAFNSFHTKHTGGLSVSFSSDISGLVLPVTDILAGVFESFIYGGNHD